METVRETGTTEAAGWSPGLAAAPPPGDDMQKLAETFAATPEAVRMAVERVGTDFRALQRELGGRR